MVLTHIHCTFSMRVAIDKASRQLPFEAIVTSSYEVKMWRLLMN